mgnify:CR=1 FL=1
MPFVYKWAAITNLNLLSPPFSFEKMYYYVRIISDRYSNPWKQDKCISLDGIRKNLGIKVSASYCNLNCTVH